VLELRSALAMTASRSSWGRSRRALELPAELREAGPWSPVLASQPGDLRALEALRRLACAPTTPRWARQLRSPA
jgi:hypothetical protein